MKHFYTSHARQVCHALDIFDELKTHLFALAAKRRKYWSEKE